MQDLTQAIAHISLIDMINTDPFLIFFGSFYIVLGVSCFSAKEHWQNFLKAFLEYDALSLIMGIFVLPISLFIIFFYNDWETLASTILMIVGYLGFLKSLFLLLWPAFVQKIVEKNFVQKWMWLDGLSGIALGAAMILM